MSTPASTLTPPPNPTSTQISTQTSGHIKISCNSAASLTEAHFQHPLVQAALNLAQQHYPANATTPSGEPLLSHVTLAAEKVAQMDLLAEAVAACLLVDLPNMRKDWRDQVRIACNAEVVNLVAGLDQIQKLTKITQSEKFLKPEEHQQQAEAMRQMLLAMVSDIRVVLIKLALRTQTMMHLDKCKDETLKQTTAQETLEIFAPLANRLGVWQLKWQLEDLGFRYQNPAEYQRIAKLLDEKRTERLSYINDFVEQVKHELEQAGLTCEVAGRPKHIYSIYKKMVKKKLDFEGLYDIRAVRILVNTVAECYTTLGLVHHLWQPIPGEFDDYIAHPKANDYQSLHTVVVGPKNKGVEIQIRTFDMHNFAEFGVAAHWRYKEGGKGDNAYEQKIAWLRRLLEWRESVGHAETLSDAGSSDPHSQEQATEQTLSHERALNDNDLAGAFRTELFNDTIYVLSPHGKVFTLPSGATPIDFAYALHTDIGNRCRGAKVNGQIVPLSTALENGQRVEIIVAKEGMPPANWLLEGWVKSSRAISKIRASIRRQNAESARENGARLLEKQLMKIHPKPNIQKLAENLGFNKPDDMQLALGRGELSAHAIQKAAGAMQQKTQHEAPIVKASKIKAVGDGILIDGEAGLLSTPAKCCKPAPGDSIMGFVTKGRGVSIHRDNCPSFLRLAEKSPDKVVAASWSRAIQSVFAIDIELSAQDRSGLLRDVSEALTRNKMNVTAVQTRSHDFEATMRFTLEVKQVEDLARVLHALSDIHGVTSVRRL